MSLSLVIACQKHKVAMWIYSGDEPKIRTFYHEHWQCNLEQYGTVVLSDDQADDPWLMASDQSTHSPHTTAWSMIDSSSQPPIPHPGTVAKMIKDDIHALWRMLRGRCINCGGKREPLRRSPQNSPVCLRCLRLRKSDIIAENGA